jgi:lipid II:glycine glycyltransferase (peptidoglycan interpeptide bridge formation enzyme)
MNPYFNQSQQWSDFFNSTHDSNHKTIEFKTSHGQSIYIYEYPLFRKSKFWYVPRLLITNKDSIVSDLIRLVNDIKSLANSQNIVFVGFDFDQRMLDQLAIREDDHEIKAFSDLIGVKFRQATKKLQYPSTPYLPTTDLKGTSDMTVEEFYNANEKTLFSRANQACRRHTRRSMAKGWSYEITNDDKYFDEFWDIWKTTAKRQGFNLHPKSYIKNLLEFEWVKLLVIKDKEDTVQGGWFELLIEDSLINIYGANTQKSLDDYGQYFSHVVALKYILELQEEGNLITSYDMGGADEAGYGLFKKSYRPDYLNFVGQYDLVLNPIVYYTYFNIRQLSKKAKTLIKRRRTSK